MLGKRWLGSWCNNLSHKYLASVEIEVTMREVGRFMDSRSAATSSLIAFRFGRPPASDASVVDVGLPVVAVDPGVPGPPAVIGVVAFF